MTIWNALAAGGALWFALMACNSAFGLPTALELPGHRWLWLLGGLTAFSFGFGLCLQAAIP